MSVLSTALPEFLGALAATGVTTLCSWGVRSLRGRRRLPTSAPCEEAAPGPARPTDKRTFDRPKKAGREPVVAEARKCEAQVDGETPRASLPGGQMPRQGGRQVVPGQAGFADSSAVLGVEHLLDKRVLAEADDAGEEEASPELPRRRQPAGHFADLGVAHAYLDGLGSGGDQAEAGWRMLSESSAGAGYSSRTPYCQDRWWRVRGRGSDGEEDGEVAAPGPARTGQSHPGSLLLARRAGARPWISSHAAFGLYQEQVQRESRRCQPAGAWPLPEGTSVGV